MNDTCQIEFSPTLTEFNKVERGFARIPGWH
jgi:hypothetical protein